ncbi:flagellar FliL protein [Lachnospiraceae bacterium KHCPX20]|jgi:flagellar FliL protein|nr:flagellar FliL protein [Lachnospiraceae bacterium KHCPX20]
MKKSLLTLITLALVLVNLVLTAVLAISILPEVKQANGLIAKVSEAIDLDAQSASNGGTNVSLEDLDAMDFPDPLTINLKPSGDGKEHYANIKLSLSLNKKSDNYKEYKEKLDGGSITSLVTGAVTKVVSQYTIDQLRDGQSEIQDACTESLKSIFGEGFVVGVVFASIQYQ